MAKYGRNSDRKVKLSIGARREVVKGRKGRGEGSVCTILPLTQTLAREEMVERADAS
jgi:hypothetical protein